MNVSPDLLLVHCSRRQATGDTPSKSADSVPSRYPREVLYTMADQEEAEVTVTLISGDGKEFTLPKSICMEGSETMRAMLQGKFRESEKNEIRFPEIAGDILGKVVEYLKFKNQHRNATGKIPEFDIEPEIAIELLVAASYLNC